MNTQISLDDVIADGLSKNTEIDELRTALQELADAAGSGRGTFVQCLCGAEAGQRHTLDCPVLKARKVLESIPK